MNAIDELINQAETKSAEVTGNDQVPATQNQHTDLARRPSLDNLMSSGMSVELYLKVSEDGLKVVVDNKSTLFENVEVTIDMKEVIATEAIKWGNPAVYNKTFDGIMAADGTTKWTDILEMGQRFGATPYASSDIPMTLNEDIKNAKGEVVLQAGTRIGYSLSTTNREAFAKFLREVNEQNLRHSTVLAKLGYEAKTNKKNNVWGIVTFELLGENDE